MNFNTYDATCYAYVDGALTASTIAGNGGEIFTITNSSGTQLNLSNSNTANNLGKGWYYCHIIDNMSCEIYDSVFINSPDQLATTITIVEPLSYGAQDGYVIVDTVFNYTGSYNLVQYFWNPNPSGLNGLGQDSCGQISAGEYELIINDQFGCSRVFDMAIESPDSLFFGALGVTHNTGMNDGVVFCSASGGAGTHSYLWTNMQTNATSTNSTWSGLSVGSYMIEVTDENDIVLSAIVELGYLAVDDQTKNQPKVYPTLIQQGTVKLDNPMNETIRFVIYNTQGQKVYDELIAPGKKELLLNLENGSYFYQIVEINTTEKILNEGKLIVTE